MAIIHKWNQYNQSIGESKILSSTAGVGAIVTTNWGGFVMPLSIDNWKFVQNLHNEITKRPNAPVQNLERDAYVNIIKDSRFIKFLSERFGLSNLKHLVAIPKAQLNGYNCIDIKKHPINQKLESLDLAPFDDRDIISIPAINFPRWFIANDFSLKTIDEWETEWNRAGNRSDFVPPRDPNDRLLTPVPMVLICHNGHISDIPWDKYFSAKIHNENIDNPNGFDLFRYQNLECPNSPSHRHELKWITNRNQSESWGTLKCVHCNQVVSLAGIMNIKPKCHGDRPWELNLRNQRAGIPCDDNCGELMRVVMVTSNSVYYANNINSLYIPEGLLEQLDALSPNAQEMLQIIQGNMYETYRKSADNPSRADFWQHKIDEMGATASIENIDLTDNDWSDIKRTFLNEADERTSYRLDEYEVFKNNDSCNEAELEFADIILPDSLRTYFTSIKKLNTLAVTTTQLGFSRVSIPTPTIDNDGTVNYHNERIQHIYGNANIVNVLPAYQIFGEGILFMFDETKVNQWAADNGLNKYYEAHLENDDLGKYMSDEIEMYGRARFYLLHTFSHILMKELEFSCGYPTASMHERLYYSDRMCGVLIYTADGTEGSMGGLVWQAQPELIERIIKSALKRAMNCPSDPLCWENRDGLNRAACFSCSMISETSCERRNLGLDRRALVDEKFGYFKDLIL